VSLFMRLSVCKRECVCVCCLTPCLKREIEKVGILLRKFLFVMFYRRKRERKKVWNRNYKLLETPSGKNVFDIFFVNIFFFLLPSLQIC